MVFIATFNNFSVLSWRSVLLVEEYKPENKFTNYMRIIKFAFNESPCHACVTLKMN
jgi:hypothetical protein